MKRLINNIPILRSIAKVIFFTLIEPFKSFPGSDIYWKKRYKSGGNSGLGSYQKLAEFKSETLNEFVGNNQIRTIIEYGCGDGNQLILSQYQSYIGFDISQEAILHCELLFAEDESKTFKLMEAYANEKAELTLSLDVIYHLIEDNVFCAYMNRLFDSSTKYVIIYSSNFDKQERLQAAHVKHRKFTEWVEISKLEWKLIQHIPNRYPYSRDKYNGSFAEFYVYERIEPMVVKK